MGVPMALLRFSSPRFENTLNVAGPISLNFGF